MKGRFVGIGLTLVAVAVALTALGRYDGILGATPPEEFLQADGPETAIVRLEVLGSPAAASTDFETFRLGLVLPGPMVLQMQTGSFVPVQLEDSGLQDVYLQVQGEAPEPGRLLVVEALVQTHWPLQGDGLEPVPIVFLIALETHEPLVFRD